MRARSTLKPGTTGSPRSDSDSESSTGWPSARYTSTVRSYGLTTQTTCTPTSM